jgi:DNA-3-methyladenine glycosylase II
LLSAATAFSTVEEKWLREAPYQDMYSWLRNIKGIGEWSANFVMIRGLGRMERLSVEDHLASAASRIYGSGKKLVDKQKVLELAKRYGKNQGYWAYYLRSYSGRNRMRMD